jgi:hypothetical protein
MTKEELITAKLQLEKDLTMIIQNRVTEFKQSTDFTPRSITINMKNFFHHAVGVIEGCNDYIVDSVQTEIIVK